VYRPIGCMHAFPTEWARAQFPALQLAIEGQPAIFLDGPGGTQVPEPVIKAVCDYYRKNNSNLGGQFVTSQNTAELVQRARVQLAEFLNARAPEEIIFGANMTTLTFSLSRALARTWRPGDEVIVTSLDHDANITPWRVAAGERGAVVRTWELDLETCTLKLADLQRLLSPRTRLVAVTLASNAIGSVIDVASVCRLAHGSGAQVFVDAVHFAPHGPIDVQGLGCDYLACSAYKFFGPHLGVLWGRSQLLEQLESYKVRPAPSCAPGKWETGTQNFEAIAGVQAALAYLREVGYRTSGQAILHDAMNVIREHEMHLSQAFLEGVRSQHRIEIYGSADPEECETRTPTFAFRVHGVTPAEVAEKLAHAGIFVWSGHFYAVDLVERLGLAKDGGLLRAGFVHYNTLEEVERTLDALARI
jgi:cysteine desulfurase family protein (TIGR01976 family)